MSFMPPRLRGFRRGRSSLYPLGEFPESMAVKLSKRFVHLLAGGHSDISGDDFGGMFAAAIGGIHSPSPLGVTDVTWNSCSWSAKTVKSNSPFSQQSVRLISGRNSPDYSFGISNPRDNLEETGRAVLSIWNARIDQSLVNCDDLRVIVLIRNMERLEFSLFEYEAGHYSPSDYTWNVNRRENLEGFEVSTGEHLFTWQPHGSQFTVIKRVPGSAFKFRILRRPSQLEMQHVLEAVGFRDDWVERVF